MQGVATADLVLGTAVRGDRSRDTGPGKLQERQFQGRTEEGKGPKAGMCTATTFCPALPLLFLMEKLADYAEMGDRPVSRSSGSRG